MIIIGLALVSLIFGARASDAASPRYPQADFMAEAIRLAHDSQKETGVPSSVTLAQAIFETGYGGKPIGEANNYFGIKASVRADGSVNFGRVAIGWVWAWTKEWNGYRYVDVISRFRKYRDMSDSFHDHGYLLVETARYAEAMRHTDDPREFARQIAAAGYATAPDYADKLIHLMDTQNLYQFDLKRDDAIFLDQSDYPTVEPGQTFDIYFEVKNTGFGTWRDAENYQLMSVYNLRLGAAARQAIENEVPPDGVQRWSITMTAPTTPGVYRTQWAITHGAQKFGPDMYIDVTVGKPENRGALEVLLLMSSTLLAGFGIRIWRQRHRAAQTEKSLAKKPKD